jgi:hypothetical protein
VGDAGHILILPPDAAGKGVEWLVGQLKDR